MEADLAEKRRKWNPRAAFAKFVKPDPSQIVRDGLLDHFDPHDKRAVRGLMEHVAQLGVWEAQEPKQTSSSGQETARVHRFYHRYRLFFRPFVYKEERSRWNPDFHGCNTGVFLHALQQWFGAHMAVLVGLLKMFVFALILGLLGDQRIVARYTQHHGDDRDGVAGGGAFVNSGGIVTQLVDVPDLIPPWRTGAGETATWRSATSSFEYVGGFGQEGAPESDARARADATAEAALGRVQFGVGSGSFLGFGINALTAQLLLSIGLVAAHLVWFLFYASPVYLNRLAGRLQIASSTQQILTMVLSLWMGLKTEFGIGREACEFLMLAMTVAAFGALVVQELVYRVGHCCGSDWLSARVYLLNIKKKALAEKAKKDEEQMLLDLEAQSSSSEEDEFDDLAPAGEEDVYVTKVKQVNPDTGKVEIVEQKRAKHTDDIENRTMMQYMERHVRDEVRDIKSEMAAMGCVYDRTFGAKQKAWAQLGLPWPDPEVAAPYRQRPKVNWDGEGLGDRLDEFAASLAKLPEPNPFSSCNIEKRLEMVKLMEQRKFLAGERIVTFGEACDEFFLVVDGGVQTRAPSAHLDAAWSKAIKAGFAKDEKPDAELVALKKRHAKLLSNMTRRGKERAKALKKKEKAAEKLKSKKPDSKSTVDMSGYRFIQPLELEEEDHEDLEQFKGKGAFNANALLLENYKNEFTADNLVRARDDGDDDKKKKKKLAGKKPKNKEEAARMEAAQKQAEYDAAGKGQVTVLALKRQKYEKLLLRGPRGDDGKTLLASAEAFAPLDARDRRQVLNAMQDDVVEFADGAVLCEEDTRCDAFLWVLRGEVLLRKWPEEEEGPETEEKKEDVPDSPRTAMRKLMEQQEKEEAEAAKTIEQKKKEAKARKEKEKQEEEEKKKKEAEEAAAKRRLWELGVKTLGPMNGVGENCLMDVDESDDELEDSGERRVRFADEEEDKKKGKKAAYTGRRPYEYTVVAVGSVTVARLTREEWVEIVS